jgi:hypothetical protein
MVYLADRAVQYCQHSVLNNRTHWPAGAVLITVLYVMHHLRHQKTAVAWGFEPNESCFGSLWCDPMGSLRSWSIRRWGRDRNCTHRVAGLLLPHHSLELPHVNYTNTLRGYLLMLAKFLVYCCVCHGGECC